MLCSFGTLCHKLEANLDSLIFKNITAMEHITMYDESLHTNIRIVLSAQKLNATLSIRIVLSILLP